MRAEEIQKLLELQQQQFQKNQSELQERQNQQLLLQQQQIAELIEKLGSKDAKQIEQDKSADYWLPDCGSELKQNCIRLIENKVKKNEDCTLKDLLNDCKIFLATKKEVKLLSEPKQEPKLHSIEEKSPTKNWNNYRPNYRPPPKIPYCNHCKKDGHWTLNCYFAGRRKFSPRVNTIKIQPLIENQPSKKKIVWEKQKPLKKPIVQVKYCKGKKVLVKNKNNRSGVIEWLKGEIVGKIGKLFRIEVYCLKNIILRKIEDIKEDNSQAKNNSKKYNVQRSEEMPCIDESTPNKRAKILAEGSDDQIISTSEGTSHKDEKKRRYVKINNVIKKFFPSFL